MSRRIALWSLRLALATLPPARRSWGRAMRAELDHVEGREGLAFALGCLAAALGERLRSISGPEGARLAFAAAALGLAAFHLSCAADGVRILAGAADPFHQALLRSGSAATADHWRAFTPILTAGFGALGLAELLAAIFAARANRAAFAKVLGAAVLIVMAQAAAVFSVLGYVAGLQTFLAVMGLLAACSCLLLRFAMARPAPARP